MPGCLTLPDSLLAIWSPGVKSPGPRIRRRPCRISMPEPAGEPARQCLAGGWRVSCGPVAAVALPHRPGHSVSYPELAAIAAAAGDRSWTGDRRVRRPPAAEFRRPADRPPADPQRGWGRAERHQVGPSRTGQSACRQPNRQRCCRRQIFGIDPYPSHAVSYVTLCIRPSSRPVEKYPPLCTAGWCV
jgi:hypothetical protein